MFFIHLMSRLLNSVEWYSLMGMNNLPIIHTVRVSDGLCYMDKVSLKGSVFCLHIWVKGPLWSGKEGQCLPVAGTV